MFRYSKRGRAVIAVLMIVLGLLVVRLFVDWSRAIDITALVLEAIALIVSATLKLGNDADKNEQTRRDQWVIAPLAFAVLLVSTAHVVRDGGPSLREPTTPVLARSPSSAVGSSTAPPVAANYVGRLASAVQTELEALGITPTIRYVIDDQRRLDEIVDQSPPPGSPITGSVELVAVKHTSRTDLIDCCVRVVSDSSICFSWDFDEATIGRTTYEHALRYYDQYRCGVEEHRVAINIGGAIRRLTAITGIPTESTVSGERRVTLTVNIDGQQVLKKSLDVSHPLQLDLNVADAVRVELHYEADHASGSGGTALAIAEVYGYE